MGDLPAVVERSDTDLRGRFMRLPSRETIHARIPADLVIEDGIFDHPVVVLSRRAPRSGVVQALIVTSFGNKPIEIRHQDQRARRGYLPIHPAVHPDTTDVLTVAHGKRMKKPSYVNTNHICQLPISILRNLWGDKDLRLEKKSFRTVLRVIVPRITGTVNPEHGQNSPSPRVILHPIIRPPPRTLTDDLANARIPTYANVLSRPYQARWASTPPLASGPGQASAASYGTFTGSHMISTRSTPNMASPAQVTGSHPWVRSDLDPYGSYRHMSLGASVVPARRQTDSYGTHRQSHGYLAHGERSRPVGEPNGVRICLFVFMLLAFFCFLGYGWPEGDRA